MESLPSHPLWARNPRKSLQENKSKDRSLLEHHQETDPSVKNCVPDYVRVILVTDMNGRKRKLYIPAALDLDRPKRPRTNFSSEQLRILELEFAENHFISETRRQVLAQALALTETQIKVWFQNRRTKSRRHDSLSPPLPPLQFHPLPTLQSTFNTQYFEIPVAATYNSTTKFSGLQQEIRSTIPAKSSF